MAGIKSEDKVVVWIVSIVIVCILGISIALLMKRSGGANGGSMRNNVQDIREKYRNR